jgi:hypothetical protein
MFSKFFKKFFVKYGENVAKESVKRARKGNQYPTNPFLGGKRRKRKAQKKAAVVTIDLDESMKILNFEAGDEITNEILSERYFDYLNRNSDEKGSSVYLCAKIENAKDALVAEYGLRIIEPEVEEEETESGENENEKENEDA